MPTFDKHAHPDFTAEQRANLATLSHFLRTDPRVIGHFDMDEFICVPSALSYAMPINVDAERLSVCGTSACATGWGPVAGIEPLTGEGWGDYGSRAFGAGRHNTGNSGAAFTFLFGTEWPNEPQLAADRIDYVLAHGVPLQLGGWPVDSLQFHGIDPDADERDIDDELTDD